LTLHEISPHALILLEYPDILDPRAVHIKSDLGTYSRLAYAGSHTDSVVDALMPMLDSHKDARES
jgi:hypothetical protein